jgi:hypothetical protein
MKSSPWLVLVALMLGLDHPTPTPVPPSVHYYVQLVWGTNHQKPAAAEFRPVGPKLKAELGRIFQWQQYWEANYKELVVQSGKASRIRLSPECEVEIELVSPTDRETRIFGKGILVTQCRRKIHCQNLSIHGGSTEAGGSWFVVVREDKPRKGD